MAWVYLKLNDLARGLELLRQNLEKNPQDPWLNHTLSLFYFQLGDYQKTKWHNDQTLKLKRFPVALALQQELNKMQTFFLTRVLFRTGLSLLIIAIGLKVVAII
jgi:tetratricopeptide (TPR) repeat protein